MYFQLQVLKKDRLVQLYLDKQERMQRNTVKTNMLNNINKGDATVSWRELQVGTEAAKSPKSRLRPPPRACFYVLQAVPPSGSVVVRYRQV